MTDPDFCTVPARAHACVGNGCFRRLAKVGREKDVLKLETEAGLESRHVHLPRTRLVLTSTLSTPMPSGSDRNHSRRCIAVWKMVGVIHRQFILLKLRCNTKGLRFVHRG